MVILWKLENFQSFERQMDRDVVSMNLFVSDEQQTLASLIIPSTQISFKSIGSLVMIQLPAFPHKTYRPFHSFIIYLITVLSWQ